LQSTISVNADKSGMQGKSSRVVMDYLLQRLHGLLQQQQQPGEERERERG